MSQIFSAIFDGVTKAVLASGNVIGKGAEEVGKGVVSVGKEAVAGAQVVGEAAKDVGKQAVDAVGKGIGSVKGLLQGYFMPCLY